MCDVGFVMLVKLEEKEFGNSKLKLRIFRLSVSVILYLLSLMCAVFSLNFLFIALPSLVIYLCYITVFTLRDVPPKDCEIRLRKKQIEFCITEFVTGFWRKMFQETCICAVYESTIEIVHYQETGRLCVRCIGDISKVSKKTKDKTCKYSKLHSVKIRLTLIANDRIVKEITQRTPLKVCHIKKGVVEV